MFVQIDGTKKVRHDSLLASYIRMLGVKSWCALFISSCGVLAVLVAYLVVLGYGTMILTGMLHHFEEPFFLMAPAWVIAVASWLVFIGNVIFHVGQWVGATALQFWDWSQNSCSLIEYDYKTPAERQRQDEN